MEITQKKKITKQQLTTKIISKKKRSKNLLLALN